MTVRIFSTTLAAALLSSVALLPGIVQASSDSPVLLAQQVNAPQIDYFSVKPVERLSPGAELVFTLQGTPNAQATLTIGNTARNLPMRETESGVYEGRYTIRSQDQFTENTPVRANLMKGDRVSSSRLQQPLVASGSTTTTPSATSSNQAVAIESFKAQPVQQLDPGTELDFTLVGTPKAKATFSIEGVTNNQPLSEVSPGTYEGKYVIRRQDVLPTAGNVNVTARLQSGRDSIRARLDSPLVASGSGSTTTTTQLPLEIISPQNNSSVQGSVELKGRSAPGATVSVNVQAVTSLAGLVGVNRNILSQSVQADPQGNFSVSFKPTPAIPGTQYQVSLKASKGDRTNEESLVLQQQ